MRLKGIHSPLFSTIIIISFKNIFGSTPVFKDSNTNLNSISLLRSSINSNTKNDISSRDINNVRESTIATSKKHAKKWQVGRVSRKHYEIINMLWRKTKIFLDEDTITEVSPRRENDSRIKFKDNVPQKIHTFLPRPILPASTQSFIEFYYLDETDDVKETTPRYVKNHGKDKVRPTRKFGNYKLALLNPVFAFHIDSPHYKRTAVPTRYMQPRYRKPRTYKVPLIDFNSVSSLKSPYKFPYKKRLQTGVTAKDLTRPEGKLMSNSTEGLSNKFATENKFDNETCPYTTDDLSVDNITESGNPYSNSTPSTPNDKIKFFELYDRYTYEPNYDKRKSVEGDIEFVAYRKEPRDDQKISLEHVDQNMEHNHSSNKTKHAKKHIVDNDHLLLGHENNNLTNKKLMETVMLRTLNETTVSIKKKPTRSLISYEKLPKFLQQNMSRFATWSEYPFVAVYTYEPLQVHCDAASINRHWLITAGSCLYRHHKRPGGTGQSAFVTYCGETWWNPERVAYVKYSVVHPRYHSSDMTRKHLYNIGLIEVVSSLASACPGWSPISLMSHQLVSDDGETTAMAIGWGLDRFDTREPSSSLPKLPLSVYSSRVYSGSCPGNFKYGKAKRLDEDSSIKNVYCLSLPPYFTEETDPVHGGLLLVGGKLIALYLQEERRPWGAQCAQYTGTWRLIPWVLDVAREPDDADSFIVDI